MDKENIDELESQIKDLGALWSSLASDQELLEMVQVARRPGWTTPAEFVFVKGIVDSILLQLNTLTKLKRILLEGSRQVSGQ